jgi:uncharacterized membrane protein YqiK
MTTLHVEVDEALLAKLNARAQRENGTIEAVAARAISEALVNGDDDHELAALIAHIRSLPKDPAYEREHQPSLADVLRNMDGPSGLSVEEFEALWPAIEAEIEGLDRPA